MRANEFLIEGPVDKAGDWMNKQVIDRKQMDKAKARKQNVPKIAKMIQQQLETSLHRLFAKHAQEPIENIHEEVPLLITKYLSKALKVDVMKNPDAFGDSVEELLTSLDTELDNFGTSDTILKHITNVVDKSFDAKSEYSSINKKLIAQLREKKKDMEPKEARQTILTYAKKQGHDNDTANQIADEVLGDRTDQDSRDEGPDEFEAEVFLINGNYTKRAEGKQKAYVNRDGKWSIWRLAKRDIWEFETSVANDTEDAAIEKLIADSDVQPIPMSFDRTDGQTYKVQ